MHENFGEIIKGTSIVICFISHLKNKHSWKYIQKQAKANDAQHYRDSVLSSMLVLSQLNYPAEIKTAEFIFERIRSKQSFSFPDFSTYIICPDFLEEFMYLYTNESKIHLELNTPTASSLTRRIGTRGSDRGIKDEFKQLIRKQMARSNEDIEVLILQFIAQERGLLMQLIFDWILIEFFQLSVIFLVYSK